jgi:curved DNA-binding protein CbpA
MYMQNRVHDRESNYYSILGVAQNSGEDVVKKAYRKLALKLHPDKCGAPGADEAFKKISKAFQCLSDPEKRRNYETYGDEDRGNNMGFRGGPHDDMAAAQDLFEAFFGPGIFGGPGVRRGNFHQQQRQQQHYEHHGGTPQQGFHPQGILFLIMFALMFLGNFGREAEPAFSFKPTVKLNVPRESTNLQARYYVGQDFEPQKAKANFDNMVEVYYVHHLSSECDYETTVMLKKLRKAKMSGDQERINQAKKMPKQSCDQLDKIKRRHPKIYHSALSWH